MAGWIVTWALAVVTVLAVYANHRYHWAAGWRYSRQYAQHVTRQAECEPPARDFYGSMDLDTERGLYWPAPTRWEAAREDGPDWREQTAADLSPEALDSDIQPDPYIDTIAAEHVTEFEPELHRCIWYEADTPDAETPCPVCSWPRCAVCERCIDQTAHDLEDSGPGALSSLTPGPAQMSMLPDQEQSEVSPDQGDDLRTLADISRGGAGEGLYPLPAPTRLADTGDIASARLLAEVQAELRAQDDDTTAYLSRLRSDCAQYRRGLAEALA